MTKRIFRTIFSVAVSVFLACALLFMTDLYDYFSDNALNQLQVQTDLAAQGVDTSGADYFYGLQTENYRITWIGADGDVLYDNVSSADEMENHFQREEIKEALSEGYGTSSRYSSTLMQRYLYSAKRLSDGTVLRLSLSHNSLLSLTFGMLQPIIVIFLFAVILSAILAFRLSKNIVKPLKMLDVDAPLENDGYDELSPLLRRIDVQQREIKRQGDELGRKKREFDVLTSSMSEGIILLDHLGAILSINQAALTLFQTEPTCVGQDILTVSRNVGLHRILERAKHGNQAETILELGGRIYQVNASSVLTETELCGVVLLLLDITEKEKAELLRREFTANVSHELKTPLHTISGYAELLANGMVKPEDVTDFSRRIYAEAGRMIRLVEDIIKLSHLDEGADDMKWEETDLFQIANRVMKALAPEAENAGIEMELCGETAILYGIPQLLGSIVYNLCDNAIKYNHKGGSIFISIQDEKEYVLFSVADTGIGIPAEHQERIFERFYRVDKSHSKEIGGTGLGLSIVKHAARLHEAVIELQSVVDSGTTVTVKFPKNR